MTKTAARIPGAAPVVAPADDDLDIPEGGALPAVDPVQAQLAELQAKLRRLERASADQPSKPAERQPDAASQAEAAAMAAEQVAAGVRPRALLTPDGWYVHPESARVPGSLGNVKAA